MNENQTSGHGVDDYQNCLFPPEEMMSITSVIENTGKSHKNSHEYRKSHCNNLDLCLSMKGRGMWAMPDLRPYHGPLPDGLIPFSAATSSVDYKMGVHFYIDDYMFERIWSSPEAYLGKLSKFSCVIGPDFSQYCNMSYPMRIWNCYRNRVISSFLQENGVSLIPNVTWSLPDSYDYSFEGIPQNSIIAINCSSIIHCNLSKYLWYKGYNEAIKRLNPSYIIRYGSVMPDERADISVYFENERLKMLRHGR